MGFAVTVELQEGIDLFFRDDADAVGFEELGTDAHAGDGSPIEEAVMDRMGSTSGGILFQNSGSDTEITAKGICFRSPFVIIGRDVGPLEGKDTIAANFRGFAGALEPAFHFRAEGNEIEEMHEFFEFGDAIRTPVVPSGVTDEAGRNKDFFHNGQIISGFI